jgi:hypothetical protein
MWVKAREREKNKEKCVNRAMFLTLPVPVEYVRTTQQTQTMLVPRAPVLRGRAVDHLHTLEGESGKRVRCVSMFK